jgi:poly [ADP-ribose] polymerase
MSDDVIEPAASGRASCRTCKEKIDKGVLRFGEKVPSNFGDGDQTFWFHLACAAERKPGKLAAALARYEGEIPDRAALDAIVADGVQNPALATVLRAEKAPTGRAGCQHCHEKIGKDELRVAIERDQEGMMPTAAYVHGKCAGKHVSPVGLVRKLRRTSPGLAPADLDELEKLIG